MLGLKVATAGQPLLASRQLREARAGDTCACGAGVEQRSHVGGKASAAHGGKLAGPHSSRNPAFRRQQQQCRSHPVAAATAVEDRIELGRMDEASPALLDLQRITQDLRSCMAEMQSYTGTAPPTFHLSDEDLSRLERARIEGAVLEGAVQPSSEDAEEPSLAAARSALAQPLPNPVSPAVASPWQTSSASAPRATSATAAAAAALKLDNLQLQAAEEARLPPPAASPAQSQSQPSAAYLAEAYRSSPLPQAPLLPCVMPQTDDVIVASATKAAAPAVRVRAPARRRKAAAWGKVEAEVDPTAEIAATGRRSSPGSSADTMKMFMRHAGSFKLLTGNEEKVLAINIRRWVRLKELAVELGEELGREALPQETAARAGLDMTEFQRRVTVGEASRQQMIDCNHRLVLSIAKKYMYRGLPMEDLVAEGVAGLAKAAERFDPTRGFKFSTYAHWWIRQSVSRSVVDQARVIRLPVHLHDLAIRIRRTERELAAELERPPTAEEVAEVVGITAEKLHLLDKASKLPASTSAPLSADSEGSTLEDSLVDEGADSVDDCAVHRLLSSDLDNVLHTLSPRECGVLRMRYGLDDGIEKTLEEIGKRFKVTRERIRQIESKALRKMRQPTRQSMLRDYGSEPIVGLADRKSGSARRSG